MSPTAQELLLYDACSAIECPVRTHNCLQAHMIRSGDRFSSAYKDAASEYNYHL